MTDQPAYAGDIPAPVYDYDAFLSYSRADTAVAEGIQKGLHKIGRKMGRLHALRVFRDKTDLAASPSLWDKLQNALDRSRYLIVVLSPNSAGSEWVNKEVEYWLTHRGRDNLVLVLADGTILWDDTHGRFDPDNSTAAVPALLQQDSLQTEPIYIDVSPDDPWDITNPTFRDKVTDIAAPIHGKPKYELASEDLREQQRFRRFRRAAIAALAALVAISIAAASVAFLQRREAIEQRNDAFAGRLVSDGEAILQKVRGGGDDRALQELISAYRISPTTAQGGLLAGLQATASTRKIIRTPDTVGSVAVTPDGNRIYASAGDTPVVRIFDAHTGATLGELDGHTEGVTSVALNADGTRLVSGSYDKTVRVWDTATGQQLGGPLTGFPGWVTTVAISPDGNRVAAGGFAQEHAAKVWDITSGHPTGLTLPGLAEDVNSVAFSPDGRRVVTGDGSGTIQFWNPETGERQGEPIVNELASVWSVAFSPDGQRLVSGHGDNLIRQWDTATGQLIGAPLTGHSEVVSTVAYSHDGRMIVSGSWDKTVRLWSAGSGQSIAEPMTGHEDNVDQVTFSPDDHSLVSGSSDTTVRVWDADYSHFGRTATLGSFFTTALSPDTRLFAGATSASPPVIAIGDNIEEKQVSSWTLTPEEIVSAMAFSPDHSRLAIGTTPQSGSDRRSIQIWDVESATMLVEIDQPHQFGVTTLSFSPDGSRLASGGNEPTVRIWDAATGKQSGPDLTGAESDINAVAFSPDGEQLAAGGKDRQVRVWSAETGDPIGEPLGGHKIGVKSVAFSPDGRHLASGDDEAVRLWDARTHQLAGAPLTGHDDSVDSLTFSPDSQLLASGSMDNSVRIWDVGSGAQIGSPLIEEFQTNAMLAFSPDGERLMSVSASNGKLSIWPGPTRWPDLVCDRLSSNMSRAQWNLWVSPDIDYIVACPDLPVPE